MTRTNQVSSVGNSWLVPTVERILRSLSYLSLYHWIVRWKRHKGQWPDDELIRFSFVEKYVVLFPVILGSLWVFTSLICPKCLWIVAVIAGYRLFDLGHGLFSIVVFEMQRDRKDEAGHYILVRHSVRWFLLFLVNLADITIAFSVLYNALGMYFTPPITSILSAMYQVSSTFTTVAGNQALES